MSAPADTSRGEAQAVASSGLSAPFAEVWQDAEPNAVRWLFGAQPATAGQPTSSGLSVPYAQESQTAEQSTAVALLGAGSPQPELSGNGFSYRHNWGPRRGQWTLRLNMGGVTARSRVFVSIGEGVAGGPDAGKFMGAARYSLFNVAPRAGGVDIWINIEWSADILLYVDYLIVNP